MMIIIIININIAAVIIIVEVVRAMNNEPVGFVYEGSSLPRIKSNVIVG